MDIDIRRRAVLVQHELMRKVMDVVTVRADGCGVDDELE